MDVIAETTFVIGSDAFTLDFKGCGVKLAVFLKIRTSIRTAILPDIRDIAFALDTFDDPLLIMHANSPRSQLSGLLNLACVAFCLLSPCWFLAQSR